MRRLRVLGAKGFLRAVMASAAAAVVVGSIGAGAAQAASPISTAGFDLSRTSTSSAVLSALDTALPNLSIDTVAADANRVGPTGSACGSVLPHVIKKYCWADDDNDTEQWYPQGVSTTYDAYGGAGTTAGGRSLIATSWYDHDGGTDKGARVSILDRANAKYRHVLLAVPGGTSTSPTFSIASTHAGGLAWYGRYLYVADTTGIRVFDMGRMWSVNTSITDAIGKTSAGYGAYGYKYVAPQVHRYARTGTFRYSSVSIDRTTTPDTLIATEYRAPGDTAQVSPRTVRYNLDETSKLIAETTSTVAGADGAWDIGVDSLQGGVFVNGSLFLSQSDGGSVAGTDNDRGDLYRYTPSSGSLVSWGNHLPVGTEDFSYWSGRGELWTTAEYPTLRGLYALDYGYYSG
ncbi:hypothetical protein [Janibacter sp. HTCC2649]|uniref:hypothetical protein n=1 Tax=Janibacter sp. HTCC2649 TaxID=313589 RepID=UPI00032366CD|nr:hypothetical protein [Janibacter sp. HTCC2649]